MQVFKLDPLSDPRWDEFLTAHPRSSVFHNPQWLLVLQRTYGYDPVVYTTAEPGQPVTDGLVFCKVSSPLTGKRLVATPFSDHCDILVDDDERLATLLEAVEADRKAQGFKYIELRPVGREREAALRELGFGESQRFVFHRLDMSADPETVFARTHRTCVKQMVRRAEREELTVEIGRTPDLISKFCHLQTLTRRRHGIPPQPREWFDNLAKSEGIDPTILVASKDGTPIASILTLQARSAGYYKYSCSDSTYSNTGGTQLLIWRAILRLKERDCEWFCMGRSDPGNAGLVEFKSRWGAEGIETSYYRCPAPAKVSGSSEESKLVKRVVSVMPEWALSAAGRFLYRHFG